jgi:tetratricopeptide (TPR) repeat protein
MRQALAAYREATRRDPAWADPHLNAGALLARQKRFVEARASFQRYLELAPESARAAEIRSAMAQLPASAREH